jgi:hypothetical protein
VPPRQPQCPGGRVKSLVSPVHPHVTLRPPRGGGALLTSRGGRVGGGACLPRMTTTKTTTINTTANTSTTKTKMAVWASSASWGHASGKPPMPKEDDMIWQLRSQFGGNSGTPSGHL